MKRERDMTEKTPAAVLREAAAEAATNPIRASELAELALDMLREPSNRQMLNLHNDRSFLLKSQAG